jgi:hypothetical protein
VSGVSIVPCLLLKVKIWNSHLHITFDLLSSKEWICKLFLPESVFLVVGESDLKCLVHSVEVLLTRSYRIFLVLSGMDIQNEIYERRTESIPWNGKQISIEG